MPEQTRDIVVLGGSAGSIEALKTILGSLSAEIPATFLLVVHTSPEGPGLLPSVLDRVGPLKARPAAHNRPFRRGELYVAPPDHHLLVRDGHMFLSRGPKENRTRPAIDPLFRSAAVNGRSRVTGLILSGYQDDGISGLGAIARCGGVTVVQSPKDALYPDMPLNALRALDVDHCLPASEIGPLLARLVREPASASPPLPDELRLEVQIAENAMNNLSDEKLGELSFFSCPECSGPLSRIQDHTVPRYRCNVGHAYTASALLEGQKEAVEKALWVALRTMEDRSRILHKMAEAGPASARRYNREAQEVLQHAEQIRQLLLRNESLGVPEETPPS